MNKKYREIPHTSYSQINTYILCPLKYYFQYVAEIKPEFVPSALLFGGSFHESLAFYYRTLKNTGAAPAVEDMIDVFRQDWMLRVESEPVQFGKDEDAAGMAVLGTRMLKAFHESVNPGEPLCIEQEFCLRKIDPSNGKILPLPIVGSIDLIERTPTGTVVAIDHKTASKRYPDSKVHEDLQLTVYTCALKRSSLVNGDPKVHCRFDVVTKATKPSFTSYSSVRTGDDHRRMFKLVSEILIAIDAGIFYPIRSWACSSCQYRNECDKW